MHWPRAWMAAPTVQDTPGRGGALHSAWTAALARAAWMSTANTGRVRSGSVRSVASEGQSSKVKRCICLSPVVLPTGSLCDGGTSVNRLAGRAADRRRADVLVGLGLRPAFLSSLGTVPAAGPDPGLFLLRLAGGQVRLAARQPGAEIPRAAAAEHRHRGTSISSTGRVAIRRAA